MELSFQVESEFSKRNIVKSVGLVGLLASCAFNLSDGAMLAIEENYSGGAFAFLRYLTPVLGATGGTTFLGASGETNKERVVGGGIGAALGAGLTYGSHIAGYYGCKAIIHGKDTMINQLIEYAPYFS